MKVNLENIDILTKENDRLHSIYLIYHIANLTNIMKGYKAMTKLSDKFKASSKTISFDDIKTNCKDRVLDRKICSLLKDKKLTAKSKIKIPLKTVKSFVGQIKVLKYMHNPDLGHFLEAEFLLNAKVEDNNLIIG